MELVILIAWVFVIAVLLGERIGILGFILIMAMFGTAWINIFPGGR